MAVTRTYTHDTEERVPETEMLKIARQEPFNLVAYLTRTNVAIRRRKEPPNKRGTSR